MKIEFYFSCFFVCSKVKSNFLLLLLVCTLWNETNSCTGFLFNIFFCVCCFFCCGDHYMCVWLIFSDVSKPRGKLMVNSELWYGLLYFILRTSKQCSNLIKSNLYLQQLRIHQMNKKPKKVIAQFTICLCFGIL